MRRGPDFLNPIEFTGGIGPPGTPGLHDRMLCVAIEHLVRIVGTMPSRGDSTELEPLIGTVAVTMHCAMNDHGRDTTLMGFQDPLRPCGIVHGSKTLIVNNDVIPLRPLRIFVQRNLGIGRRPTLLNDRDRNVCACLESLFDQLFLRGIVVAAPAGDQ